jgi:hypothetical protein
MTNQASLLDAMRSARYASRFTHHFYRYPAAASPEVVRTLIARFSQPGDLVLDPFLGGGTTAVEALALGRRFFGTDINALAVFAARGKTTPVSRPAWKRIRDWAEQSDVLRGVAPSKVTDPRAHLPPTLRRAIASGLASHLSLTTSDERLIARCALLRIAQWALESRNEGGHGAAPTGELRGEVPSVRDLSSRLIAQIEYMEGASSEFLKAAKEHGFNRGDVRANRRFMHRRAQDLGEIGPDLMPGGKRARLVVTSPPYPGVHVLYHRWQIESRRETPAPYWIIGASDGLPAKSYTMGSRTPYGEDQYFSQLTKALRAIRPLLADDCLVAQLVAFSNPERQLPRFHGSLKRAGYAMETPREMGADVTLVRQIPNRRWYARGTGSSGSQELLLFSRPAR